MKIFVKLFTRQQFYFNFLQYCHVISHFRLPIFSSIGSRVILDCATKISRYGDCYSQSTFLWLLEFGLFTFACWHRCDVMGFGLLDRRPTKIREKDFPNGIFWSYFFLQIFVYPFFFYMGFRQNPLDYLK